MENMGFHNLICISLIIGESSTFFKRIHCSHFLFVIRLFTLFAIGVVIFFILKHKSFLHMKNTHLTLRVKILVKMKSDQYAKKAQTHCLS